MSESRTMTFEEAIAIKVNGTDDSDLNYEATRLIEETVLAASVKGDPDQLLQEWIGERDYELSDTPASIAQEWDAPA